MKTSLITFLLILCSVPAFAEVAQETNLPDIDVVDKASEREPLPLVEVKERAPVTHIEVDLDRMPPATRYDNGNQNLEQDSGVKTNEEPTQKNSDKDLTELQKNVDDARANETSLKNKTIDAVGIGGVGIGGMMIGEALSEQKADSDIENEMRAYVDTFRCEYGNNPAVRGGTTNVELPGGNELFNLYAQYATLSNDLKIRKEALGIKPGIESEIVLDKSETGLYDDVGTGIVAGSYVSVARALLLGGADAAAWANQKQATTDKLNTGIAVAGVAAIGSALANVTHNGSRNKNETIKPLHDLADNINSIPPTYAPCPNNATGTAPQCTCNDSNRYYNEKKNTCDLCDGGRTAVNGECTCPADKPYYDNDKNECFARPVQCTPQCDPSTDSRLRITDDGCACYCDPYSGYTFEDGHCVCKHEELADGTCVIKQIEQIVNNVTPAPQPITDKVPLNNESLFDPVGSKQLSDDAKKEIDKFVEKLNNETYSDCTININGYADPYGATPEYNQTLSEERAKAVNDYFLALTKQKLLNPNAITKVEYHGLGQYQCKCQSGALTNACANKKVDDFLYPLPNGDNGVYKPCRRVDLEMTCWRTKMPESSSEE